MKPYKAGVRLAPDLPQARRPSSLAGTHWAQAAERNSALAPIGRQSMAQLQQAFVRNLLLAAMSADDFALLQPHLQRVRLELRQHLFRVSELISYVTFLESGILSTVADTMEGRFEVGLIGWEG